MRDDHPVAVPAQRFARAARAGARSKNDSRQSRGAPGLAAAMPSRRASGRRHQDQFRRRNRSSKAWMRSAKSAVRDGRWKKAISSIANEPQTMPDQFGPHSAGGASTSGSPKASSRRRLIVDAGPQNVASRIGRFPFGKVEVVQFVGAYQMCDAAQTVDLDREDFAASCVGDHTQRLPSARRTMTLRVG